jgi:hypothetical protein
MNRQHLRIALSLFLLLTAAVSAYAGGNVQASTYRNGDNWIITFEVSGSWYEGTEVYWKYSLDATDSKGKRHTTPEEALAFRVRCNNPMGCRGPVDVRAKHSVTVPARGFTLERVNVSRPLP